MRKVMGAICVMALAATLSWAQDAAKKPAGEKKTAAAKSDAAAKPAAKKSPYIGTWKLNVEKSQYPDKAMAPKSSTVRVTKDDETGVTWSATGTDASGKPMKMSYSGPTDGTFHPIVGNPMVATVSYKGTPSGEVDGTWKDAKGNVVGSEHITPSADGKTMTITMKMKDKDGKENTVTEVYDKQGATMNAAKKTAEKPAEKK